MLGGKLNVLKGETTEDLYAALLHPNDLEGSRWGFDLTFEDERTERVLDPLRWKELCDAKTRLVDLQACYPDHEGVAVWTRPDLARATHAKALREQGCRIVSEVDDNYLSNPNQNIFMRAAGTEWKDQVDHMKSLASMDSVIFSTAWLRDTYDKAFKKQFGKNSLPEMHVCGNHVDPRYKVERIPPREDGKLRIGFMGSSSHAWDLRLAYGALKWAADAGHEVVIIGHDPEWGDKLKYTHVPWQDPKEYRRVALPLDIGLAPLLSNSHTFGKSDIKGMEYLLSGAAPILQNNLVYNQTFKHGETALLAGSPDEFWFSVQQLANDTSLRERIVAQGNQYIQEERMISQHRKEWDEAVFG